MICDMHLTKTVKKKLVKTSYLDFSTHTNRLQLQFDKTTTEKFSHVYKEM